VRDDKRTHTVAEYVASLAPALITGPLLRRRVRSEVTEHLHDVTRRYQSQGLSESAAEARAIEDFSSEGIVADGFLDVMREVRLMIRTARSLVFWAPHYGSSRLFP
jgi:hypothetical protein